MSLALFQEKLANLISEELDIDNEGPVRVAYYEYSVLAEAMTKQLPLLLQIIRKHRPEYRDD